MKHPAHAYRQHAVQGATPLELVVMLYDGTIAALHRTMTAIDANDIEKKVAHLNKALSIIVQLEGTLDFERGGEVAKTLKNLYVYARARALQASIQNSKEMLAALAQQFSTVRESWAQVSHPAPTQPVPPSSGVAPSDPTSASPSASLRLSA
jgi:flagellar protein FliS